ncbi:MAG: helix-turn-helix domain-containing protein [Pseudomonadota bacterium]
MRLQFKLPFATIALPPPALAGCIRAYIFKDTTGRPAAPAPQLNRYPASVYCGIAWFLQGQSEHVGPDGSDPRPLPSTLLLGPQTQPLVTRNPGPVRTFGVVFQPQAFHRLTGLDMGSLVDGLLRAEDVLPAPWVALCESVRQARSDAERMELIESAVAHHGYAPPDVPGSTGTSSARWLRELQAHAQAMGLGASLRSLERHARAWAGQPVRRLAWLSRAESTLVQARQASERAGDAPRWQDVAFDAGYADQAHLCRETQRVTGHSPSELVRRVDGDDSYWFYRLWS